MELPKIALLTPTKNRRWCLDWAISVLKLQTYPKDKITWIIVDSSEKSEDSWKEIIKQDWINIIYSYCPHFDTLGLQRNKTLDIARTLDIEYCLLWDDDDFYFPDRIKYSVEMMLENPSYKVGGSTCSILGIINKNALMFCGPYGATHCLEPSVIFRRSYADYNCFDQFDKRGLLAPFLRWHKDHEPVLQLDINKLYILLGHDSNTFDKNKVYENPDKFSSKIISMSFIDYFTQFINDDMYDLFRSTFV